MKKFVTIMMIIFAVFSCFVKKLDAGNGKYATIIKEILQEARLPQNFVTQSMAEMIDENRLVTGSISDVKPSSIIRRERSISGNNDIENEYRTFQNSKERSTAVAKYNLPTTLPEDLKTAIAYLLTGIEKLNNNYDFEQNSDQVCKVLEILEYEAGILTNTKSSNITTAIDFDTSLGKVRIGSTGDDIHNGPVFLIIDLAGKDKYIGPIASSVEGNEISIVMDLQGDDVYENTAINRGAQGSGVEGIGILFDVLGDDVYKSIANSQGAGLRGGLGILWDKNGKDCYYSFKESQGFGGEVATPYENNNNQVTAYYINFSGFGLLLDSEGNDVYNSGNLPGSTSPQQPGIGHNFSQGAGWGSKGTGVLVDLKDNDSYIANLSAQGIGFWNGKGVLFDQEGDDVYFTLQYGQGASAHGGIGMFVDRKGSDKHNIGRSQGLGSGKGSDLYLNPSIGIFLDEQGNDEYNFEGDSCGVGMNDGIGYFLDMSGEDNYKGGGTGKGSLADHNYLGRKLTLGLFYDNEGTDIYSETQPEIMNHGTYSRPAVNAPGARLEASGYQLGFFKDK